VMKSMLRSLGLFIVINLAIGSAIPVIDNSAHMGGLIAGLILGVIWTWLAGSIENLGHAVLKVTAIALVICGAAFAEVQRLHQDRLLAEQSLFAMEKGDPQRATQLAQQAVARRPNDALSHIAMGEAWFRQGKFQDSAKEYQQATTLDPRNGYAQSQLGAAYVAMNQWNDAEPVLRKALQQQPDDAETQLNLGVALAGMNRTDEALEWLRKSVGNDPNSARAQFALGTLLMEKGEVPQAIAAMREAVRLDPKDAVYRKALETAEATGK
jgi:tetratricopeptide (TPR) repeat protein